MLVYLLNGQKLLGCEKIEVPDVQQGIEFVLGAKHGATFETLCNENAICLRQFAYSIFALDFEKRPNYELLRLMLEDMLENASMNLDNLS